MNVFKESWSWAPGTWGELIQGEKNGQRLLVGLPSPRGTFAYASLHHRPPLVPPVICSQLRWKARKAVRLLLEYFGETNVQIRLRFISTLQSGVGNASSSADIFSALNATLRLLGRNASDALLCNIASQVEPTNPTIIPKACLFDPDGGVIIGKENLPSFNILPLSGGKPIDTIQARSRRPRWKASEQKEFDRILSMAQTALGRGSLKEIANVSTRSALLYAQRYSRSDICKAWNEAKKIGALGIAASHSGSSVVALLPSKDSAHV